MEEFGRRDFAPVGRIRVIEPSGVCLLVRDHEGTDPMRTILAAIADALRPRALRRRTYVALADPVITRSRR